MYLDLSFFRELEQRFGAPGDFAQAYVVAHEIGHHVQTLLGVSERIHAARSRLSPSEANELSVRQELQADCYAGVWGRAGKTGSIPATLTKACAPPRPLATTDCNVVARGSVPDSFTHGSSEQRQRWLRRGLESGDVPAVRHAQRVAILSDRRIKTATPFAG